MRTLITSVLLIVTLFSLANLSHANPHLDTFGRLPFVKDIQLSPDGKHIAYLREVNHEYIVVVQSLVNPKQQPRTLKITDNRMRDINWVGDKKLLFTSTGAQYSGGDFETFTFFRTGIMDIDDGSVVWPFDSPRFTNNISGPRLESKMSKDTSHIIMSYYYRLGADATSPEQKRTARKEPKVMNAVFKINVEDGSRDRMFSKSDIMDFIVDDQGDIVMYKKYDKRSDTSMNMYLVPNTNDYEALYIKEGEELSLFDYSVIKLSPNRKTIYYYGLKDDDIGVLLEGRIEGNKVVESKIISENQTYDLDYSLVDYNTTELIGYDVRRDYNEASFFDATHAQAYADLVATFPDAEVNINSSNRENTKFVALITGDQNPEEYFLYDTQEGSLAFLGSGFPLPQDTQLRKVKRYTYKASDDLPLSAYLTLPKASEAKKHKLIVLVHGGPASRDSKIFNWERQFFAAMGYAVFQPNFRGSEGFGRAFEKAGHGEWGKRMQSDVDEGVDSLIAAGIVDPKHVCIVGASYGGYAAMYAAAAKPDMYKCAISFGGVSELSNIFYHEEQQKNTISYWTKSIGERSELDELKKHSPLFMATEKTSPILLLHGSEDTVVPSFQSDKMHKRLIELGHKDNQYIEIEGEDHWMSSGKSRRIYLENAVRFIEKNI